MLISIKRKQRMYQSCKLHRNLLGISLYKQYSNKLNRVKKISKRFYFENLIKVHKKNPKELWKCIKSVIPSKHSSNSSLVKLVVEENQ